MTGPPIEDAQTQKIPARVEVVPPAPSSRTSLPPPTKTPGTLSETAVVVLRGESAARAATFGRAAAVLSVVGLVFQSRAYPEGSPALQLAMRGALALLGVTGAWVAWRAAEPTRYDAVTGRVFAVVGLVTSCVSLLYMGVFSPITVVTALGLSFFALSDDRRFVLPLSWVAVGFYLVLATLVVIGVVPDNGVFRASAVSLEAKVATLAMVTGVLAMAIYQARLSRRAMVLAVERANSAAREVREREARLQEVNFDLDAALRVGKGKGGRYTGAKAGDFELGEIVGRGAMGEIYAAKDADGRTGAVKLLHAGALRDPDNLKRFLRESEIATRLRGPNLVEVLELGQLPNGAPYMTMELLVGEDLGRVLRQTPSMPLRDAVALVRDVARGLEIAHAAGVVHRDLKPQNLFLAAREPPLGPTWKILDFGISKLRDSTGTLTEGGLLGTPAYMAPEQARSAPSDHRTDLFALGAVAYRALTGRPAFTGDDTPQILFEIVGGSPVRPLEVAPHLPRDIEQALAIALAKKPDDRFQSARELADAFEAAAEDRLSTSLRKRARAILQAAPWGKRVCVPR